MLYFVSTFECYTLSFPLRGNLFRNSMDSRLRGNDKKEFIYEARFI